jgi:hypothetical protein
MRKIYFTNEHPRRAPHQRNVPMLLVHGARRWTLEIMEYGPKGNMVVKFWVHGHKLSAYSLGATIIFYTQTHAALRQKKVLLDTGSSPSRSQMLMAFS